MDAGVRATQEAVAECIFTYMSILRNHSTLIFLGTFQNKSELP